MDLMEHAAGVWTKRWLVLCTAIVVAACVYAARSAAPEQFVATTTVQVRLPDTGASDPSVQVGYYADTLVGLTESRVIVGQALDAVGRDDSVDHALEEISADNGEPGFVTLTAYGSSGGDASALADALGDVLAEQVAADQASDLAAQRDVITTALADLAREPVDPEDGFAVDAQERERESLLSSLRSLAEQPSWRVAVVEPAVAPDSPTAPNPLRDAILAFLIALVLAAELVVARRAWRGVLSARSPADDAGAAADAPALELRPDYGPTALAPLLPAIGDHRTLNVVQISAIGNARTAGSLGELLAARGDRVLLVDISPSRPTVHREFGVSLSPGLTDLRSGAMATSRGLDTLPKVRSLYVLAAGRPWLSGTQRSVAPIIETAPHERVLIAASVERVDELLPLAGDIGGPTVLDIEATSTTRKGLRADVAALRGLGLDVVAVTVTKAPRHWWSRPEDPDTVEKAEKADESDESDEPGGPDGSDGPDTTDKAGTAERSVR